MIKRHSVIVLLFSFTVSALILLSAYFHRHSTKEDSYSIRLIEGQQGCGYDIYLDDSLLIHQETIPAISTNIGFNSKEAAMTAAKLVTEKLKNQEHPALTKEEVANILKDKQHLEGR